MANVLIGKSRFQSRSDREREKLQAQIDTYVIRFQSDLVLKEQVEGLARLQRLAETEPTSDTKLDTYIESMYQMVERVMHV